jgi:hypothetical protein
MKQSSKMHTKKEGVKLFLVIDTGSFSSQFKSVKEEDEEDIDEDDVDDEELAQLVAMATCLSDTDEDTESDLDSPDGLRPATIGTADLSEASTNTPYSVSALSHFPILDFYVTSSCDVIRHHRSFG